MNKEVQDHLAKIKKQISHKSNDLTNKVYIEIWKGSHDTKDNMAGINIMNDKRKLVTNMHLIQLECELSYLELAKLVVDKLTEDLQGMGYEVIIENNL